MSAFYDYNGIELPEPVLPSGEFYTSKFCGT
jgi:hypothetical protein